ncbi:MAG: aspartate ammonia-lyase [Flavobacteriaceae bacterium]|nr:aspartate ammonia-lyase [Flavobacteriaceae bacterium]
MKKIKIRIEKDLIGEKEIDANAYYGVQTLRAMENFRISRSRVWHFPEFIYALAEIKEAAAKANLQLGILNNQIADAIIQACHKVKSGKFNQEFDLDMMQGGAGTSTNMAANEIIANIALEILGHKKGQYEYCHPNNHVNLSQSTNDAYPSALNIGLYRSISELEKELKLLIQSFRSKSLEFKNIIKMGRTQLQDAVPMTLEQEFEAFAYNLEEEINNLSYHQNFLLEINMGATAIGTGINTAPAYAELCRKFLADITGFQIRTAPNLIEATHDTGVYVSSSGAIKRLAIKLSKICNDLRLLSSGPRTGINEINLPAIQPGSSIMPGKVNPVIPEVVNQIAFRIIGNDFCIGMAAEAGQLQLNVMEPVMAMTLFENIEFLKNGMKTLREKCVDGITANSERAKELVMNSIGLVTALNPYLGYEVATQVAQEALANNKSVYELILEKKLMSREKLDEVLKPENMIQPRELNNQLDETASNP